MFVRDGAPGRRVGGGGGHDFASSQRSVEMKRNIPLNVVLASSEIKVELGANT